MTEEFVAFAGVDWGNAAHQVCVCDREGRRLGERAFAHNGAGLAEMCDWIQATAGAEPAAIAVGIEKPYGPVVEVLMERGFAVHALNPKQLDRFRDRHTVAGAKDDRRDAFVLSDSLRNDRHCYRRLEPENATVIEMRAWSRIGDELTEERTGLVNRVRDLLLRYYPQALQLSDDLEAEWFLELWTLAPTPEKANSLRHKTVADLLKRHHVRRIDAQAAIALLQSRPLAVAPATVAVAAAHIALLIERIRLLKGQLRDARRTLDGLIKQLVVEETPPGQPVEQHDAMILRSLPGVGRTVVATLLTEASAPLRRRDYHALRSLSGVAPVTKRSGKRHVVVRRYACHHRVREAVYHWARVAMQRDPLSRSKYQALRARGHSHGRALRGLADRLLFVACTLLARKTPFDPAHREQAAT